MPISVLQSVLAVGPLNPGATTTVAHGLQIMGNGQIPTFVMPDRITPIVVVGTPTTTQITFRNDGIFAESANFICQFDHTIQQAALAVTRYYWQGFTGVAWWAATQSFRHTSLGGTSDFMVTMPAAMPNDSYAVVATLASAANIVGIQCPDTAAGDRTTTQFRVVTTANLTAGDMIDFIVRDM